MLLADVVATSGGVAATPSRRAKVELLSSCLARMDAEGTPVGASYLAGRPRQERLDVGWATLREVESTPSASEPVLTLVEVDRVLGELATTGGRGSRSAKVTLLRDLLGRATAAEQDFLLRLVLGELRQGALEGVVVQAIARAADVEESVVRRALMLSGDLGCVASAARKGVEALRAVRLVLFRPVQPMLAGTSPGIAEALEGRGAAAVEWKLDGVRIQVHRLGDRVSLFTRNLRDVTVRMPGVVELVAGLPVESAVLDGEVIALLPDGRPRPFQETMQSFGTEREEAAPAQRLALTACFFDCLHLDGEDRLDRPLEERLSVLASILPESAGVPRRPVADPEEGEAVLRGALERGHEGVIVKDLGARYEAGRRGSAWVKVKPSHTLDLVVLAAEWGHGRRRGRLSNLHLGARSADGGFVMLGKTFKGLTDEMLAWQTERLLQLETDTTGNVVHVRPELVVEVAFDGVQASSRYPGGVALRFARVKRYREDKDAADADTIDDVRSLHRAG